MEQLKKALTEAPTLVTLDFSPSALPIHLTVDTSKVGWGAVLQQDQSDGTRRPARFDSGIWSDVEQKYDAVKLECRGLLKALKKFPVLAFRKAFYCRNGRINTRLACQPASERLTECHVNTLAHLHPPFRL